MAYKQDIDDYRESPALKVIENFEKVGAQIDFYDPFIPEYKYKGKAHKGIKKIDAAIIKNYDLVVITTAHTSIDYNMVQQNAKTVFDTKNALKEIKNRDNIELL